MFPFFYISDMIKRFVFWSDANLKEAICMQLICNSIYTACLERSVMPLELCFLLTQTQNVQSQHISFVFLQYPRVQNKMRAYGN